MLFNSLQYLVFLASVGALFYLTPRRLRWCLLLAASYAFYMCWNAYYLVLILISTFVDYVAGILLGHSQSRLVRRGLLAASIGTNLGLLFFFKYWNFFNQTAADLCSLATLDWNVPDLDFLLPVGISFYTFQTMSYTIDVYRRRIRPETHLGRFALYVAFFPQLVAGPIERAERMLPQLAGRRRFDEDCVLSGILLVLFGLFKKVVIADRLAIYVDAVYGNLPEHNGASYLLATYAFALQIYCDFSGYSDIAIGSARILGIRLTDNFRSPYFALGMQDFWRRWHISLSSWLRDYVYIPLGGSRRGLGRTSINLMATMLLGGLWHGASWGFVVWGTLHGVALVVLRVTAGVRERFYESLRLPRGVLAAFQLLITFHFVCFTWIFFRAETLADAVLVVRGMLLDWGQPFIEALPLAHAALGAAVLLAYELSRVKWVIPSLQATASLRPPRWAAFYVLVFGIVLLGVEQGRQFIYFQF